MNKLKKIFILLGTLFLILPGVSLSSETIKLTYSNFFPPMHIQSKLAEQWAQAVEKRTNGRVKVEYYPGGTLTSAPQCYQGVVDGISDIGFSVLAYSRGRFPTMAAVDLPLGYTSGQIATEVANAVYQKFQPKEFKDVQVMYFHAHGPGLIHTSKKQIRSMADLNGVKIRATGNSAKVIKALGGIPVAMPMPDSYQNIQKGVVDGGIYPVETNKGWRLGEVVSYMTDTYAAAYTTAFFVVMNQDKWQSLPQDIQKIIQEINSEWITKHGKAWDESDKEGLAYFTKKGNKVIHLDAHEAKNWKAAVQPIIKNYIQAVSAKGINGQQIVDFTISKIK